LEYIPLYFGKDEENSKGALKKKQLMFVDGHISPQNSKWLSKNLEVKDRLSILIKLPIV
jgi:hypothetical protein